MLPTFGVMNVNAFTTIFKAVCSQAPCSSSSIAAHLTVCENSNMQSLHKLNVFELSCARRRSWKPESWELHTNEAYYFSQRSRRVFENLKLWNNKLHCIALNVLYCRASTFGLFKLLYENKQDCNALAVWRTRHCQFGKPDSQLSTCVRLELVVPAILSQSAPSFLNYNQLHPS